jgi:hypothetical protein
MGMFDNIIFEDGVEVPLPEEMRVFKDIEYQTKSFDCTMSVYLIGKDNSLYLTDFERSSKKIDYHGIIEFYSYEPTDLIDYSAEFKAKFTDGILQNIELINFKKIDHESRQQKLKELQQKQRIQNDKISSRLSKAFKNYITYAIFNILGIKNSKIHFCCPEIVFLYKPTDRKISYGLFFDKISTGICLDKTKYLTSFSLKFLGFGFIYQLIEDIDWPYE